MIFHHNLRTRSARMPACRAKIPCFHWRFRPSCSRCDSRLAPASGGSTASRRWSRVWWSRRAHIPAVGRRGSTSWRQRARIRRRGRRPERRSAPRGAGAGAGRALADSARDLRARAGRIGVWQARRRDGARGRRSQSQRSARHARDRVLRGVGPALAEKLAAKGFTRWASAAEPASPLRGSAHAADGRRRAYRRGMGDLRPRHEGAEARGRRRGWK